MIATDVGGLKESILHEENGLIVNEVNVEAIAAALNDFFTGDQHQRFVANIQQLKQERSWGNFAEQLVGLVDTA